MKLFVGIILLNMWGLAVASEPSAIMPYQHREVIARNCLECHDSDTTKGQVDLEDLSFDLGSDLQVAERWQDVLNAINAGDMPPPEEQQLDVAEKTEFLADLSETLVTARKIHADTGGVIKMRRLNQREYANTMEALLGVRPVVDGLPNDRAGSGFDTAGASLFFSSSQFEQYLEIARATLEEALVHDEAIPKKTIRVEAERHGNSKVAYQKHLDAYRDEAKRSNQFKSDPNASFEELGFKSASQARLSGKRANQMIPILEKYLQRPESRAWIHHVGSCWARCFWS